MQPGFFQISLKVFLQRGTQFLVLRDALSGLGDLPGGRISHEEFYGDWTACVYRELAEELGNDVHYTLSSEPLFVFPHHIVSAGTEALGIAYHALYKGGKVQLSPEHDAQDWVDVAVYEPSPFFHPHLAAAVRRFQRLVKQQ